MPSFAEKLASVRGEAPPEPTFEERLASARGPIAQKAAARLPRMRAEEQAAQQGMQEDTIGKGLGQAAGGAVFGLGAEAVAQDEAHPWLQLAGPVGPIAAAMLPGMVRSGGNQLRKAWNDTATTFTGNAGPNAPPATPGQRGAAALRVPVRLLSAALAPVGMAGIADQADQIATDPNGMAAAGRTFGNMAMTAGAIPAARLVRPMAQQSGASLSAAAERQMGGVFDRSKPMPETSRPPAPTILDSSGQPIRLPTEPPTPSRGAVIDRSVPQLLDKRISFSGPKGFTAKANASGNPQLAEDAGALAESIPPARMPGQILGSSIRAGGGALAEGAAGYAARKMGLPIGGEIGMAHAGLQLARIAMKTVQDLSASPAWNSFSAVQKARLGSLMESGAYGEAIAYAGRLSQIHNVNDSPQRRYLEDMMRGNVVTPSDPR